MVKNQCTTIRRICAKLGIMRTLHKAESRESGKPFKSLTNEGDTREKISEPRAV
jgi:hypothetical protein